MHTAVDMHEDLVCVVKGVHSAQPCRVAGCPVNVEHEVESGEYKTHAIVIDEPARAQVCFVRREMILGCNCLERECECQSPQAGERIQRHINSNSGTGAGMAFAFAPFFASVGHGHISPGHPVF